MNNKNTSSNQNDGNKIVKTIKVLSLVALIISVLGLSIAFMAMSTNIISIKIPPKINDIIDADTGLPDDTADSDGSSSKSKGNKDNKQDDNKSTNNDSTKHGQTTSIKDWNIYFANLSKPIITGDAKVKKAPKLTATHIGNFEVNLRKPGDSVAYEFDIVNAGTLNAVISYYNDDASICTFDSDVHCDWNGNNKNDSEDLEKINENIKYTLKYANNNSSIRQGDRLLSRTKRHVILKIEYDIDATELPEGRIYLDNLDKIINYVQAK